MSEAAELIQRAKEIRTRLTRPPNAVKDEPINLKRHRIKPLKEPEVVLEHLPLAVNVLVFEDRTPPVKIDTQAILHGVCAYFRIGISDLRGHCRRITVSRPRQIAAYLMFRYTKRSSMSIGLELRKNHSSILHAKRRIVELMQSDPGIRLNVETIESWLIAGHNNHDSITR